MCSGMLPVHSRVNVQSLDSITKDKIPAVPKPPLGWQYGILERKPMPEVTSPGSVTNSLGQVSSFRCGFTGK